MKTFRGSFKLFVLLATITLLAACGNDGGNAVTDPVNCSPDCDVSGTSAKISVDETGGTVNYSPTDAPEGTTVVLNIPAGALTGKTILTITSPTTPDSDPYLIPGTEYEFGPDGTTFAVPVTLAITYDPAGIPGGAPETDLKIHKDIGATWDPYASDVDTVIHQVSTDINGFSRWGVRVTTGSGPNAIPLPPRNVNAVAGNAEVTLAWNSSKGATSYEIYRATTSGGYSVDPIITNLSNTTYTDLTALNDIQYFYVIKAVNVDGISPASAEVAVTPQLVPPAAAPANFIASAGDSKVILSWDMVNKSDNYSIYRSETSESYGAPLVTGVTTIPYIDDTAINDTTYFYKVTGSNGAGEGPLSIEQLATPQLAPPAQITGINATAGDAIVPLTWDASVKADSYLVYRTEVLGDYSAATPVDVPTNSYDDVTVLNGTTYYYVVSGVNLAGEGTISAEVSATPQVPAPGAPTGLNATPGNAVVELSWPLVVDATSYNIYRSETSGSYSVVLNSTSELNYLDTTAVNDTPYYYVITATNAGGESLASSEVGATPAVPVPPQLNMPWAKPGNLSVRLYWHTVPEAVSYNIYRATTIGGTSVATPVTNAVLPYLDSGLNNTTTYYYAVSGVNENGVEGPLSSELAVMPAYNWKSLAAGSSFVLAIDRDGNLWAWGRNNFGQVGDGTTTALPTPTMIDSGSNWVQVAAGWEHSMALKSDGSLWSWGNNGPYTALGRSCTAPCSAPGQVTGSGYAYISSTKDSNLAVKTDGTLWAWGFNQSGKLGVPNTDNTATIVSTPTQVGYDTDWLFAAVGTSNSYASKRDGTLWGMGMRVGDGTYVTRNAGPVQVCAPGTTDPCTSYLNGVVSVTTYEYASLAVLRDGTLYAWGYSNNGGTAGINSPVPARIGTASDWSEVMTFVNGTLARKQNSTLWGWGYNYNAQLGIGTTSNTAGVTQVGIDSDWAMAAKGWNVGVGVKDDGSLYTWSSNQDGQLGLGFTASAQPNPVALSGIWKDMARGAQHTLGVRTDGTLWGWGLGGNGQLGTGNINNLAAPAQAGSDIDWDTVAGGTGHSIALKTGGTVWGMGHNFYGQLGNGTSGRSPTSLPTRVCKDDTITSCTTEADQLSGVVKIAAGHMHSVALKSDGTVWSWGYNGTGQLGDGTLVDKLRPVQVCASGETDPCTTFLSNVVDIAAGYTHTFAIIDVAGARTLYAWGSNGALGVSGAPTKNPIPIQVGVETDWLSVFAGGSSIGIRGTSLPGSLWAWGGGVLTPQQFGDVSWTWLTASAGNGFSSVIRSDNTLWSWGNNSTGQLADGTLINQYNILTQEVTLATNWSSLGSQGGSLSASHNGALNTDGTLLMWGYNAIGQLGDGTGFRVSPGLTISAPPP